MVTSGKREGGTRQVGDEEIQTIMNKIRYINLCITEFAKKFGMPADIAFNYLKQYQALAFLDKCYEAEHQLSLADALKDMQMYCRKHGGTI